MGHSFDIRFSVTFKDKGIRYIYSCVCVGGEGGAEGGGGGGTPILGQYGDVPPESTPLPPPPAQAP